MWRQKESDLRVWWEGRRRRRRQQWPRVGYELDAVWREKGRAVYQGGQGWYVLQSKQENYRVVTKDDDRQGILEWLDDEHWSYCSMALMRSGLKSRVIVSLSFIYKGKEEKGELVSECKSTCMARVRLSRLSCVGEKQEREEPLEAVPSLLPNMARIRVTTS